MISTPYVHKFLTKILIISGILINSTLYPAHSQETEQIQLTRVAILNGQPVIHITKQQQTHSGLTSNILQATKFQAELIAYGESIDLQPLLDLRSRYFQAETRSKIALTKLHLAKQSLARVRNLHRNEAISKRKLQIQQSLWEQAQAHYDAIGFEIISIKESALLNWGNPLSEWAFTPNSIEFSQLISGQKTLLKITLAPGQTFPEQTDSIFISHTGSRSTAVTAHFLSLAQETNEDLQGETFFFITSANIQTGMHITAWIAKKQDDIPGVIIPSSALVRHLGQTYVYLQTGATEFTRHVVATQLQTADGFFVQSGILPGDKLVTTGAQMLLSEEFRGQIPDEDDD